MKGHLYSPTRSIAVDIDGTLVCDGRLNDKVVTWCKARKAEGFELILWTARGVKYARAVVFNFELDNLFDAVISKPGYILDDLGWDWIRYTRIVRDLAGANGNS